MSKRVILTHGDLDGMTCAILLLHILKDDPEVVITNHRHLGHSLRKLLDRSPNVTEVFITDVPLAHADRNQIVEMIEQLATQGTRIHLFDHHFGWDDPEVKPRLDRCCQTVSVDTRKTTAAAIVWRSLLRGNNPSQRWLQLLSEKADSEDPWVRERFGLLVALMRKENYPKTVPVLKALAQDMPLGAQERAMSDWYFSEKLAKEQSVAQQTQILTTSSGRKIGWLDLRPYKERLHVTPHVIAEHGVDLVVASVIRDAVLLGSESIDHGVDLTFLHGEHELDGVRMTIAGHRSPVRISPDGDATDGFLIAVRDFLTKSL